MTTQRNQEAVATGFGEAGRESGDRAVGPPVLASRAILQGHREVIIAHGTQQYRLRLTSTNKLILTK